MLTRRLAGLGLPSRVVPRIVDSVLLYCCRIIDSREFNRAVRREGYPELSAFKKQFLDVHTYPLSIWRPLFDYSLGGESELIASKYTVRQEDLWLMEMMSGEARRKITKRAMAGYPEPVPERIKKEILHQANLMANRLTRVGKKGSPLFITNHDAGIDPEDFRNDMMADACRVMARYDHFPADSARDTFKVKNRQTTYRPKTKPCSNVDYCTVDSRPIPFVFSNGAINFDNPGKGKTVVVEYSHYLKLTNYVRRSVTHACYGIINYHKSPIRTRLAELGKDKNGDWIHMATTLSLDVPVRDGSGNETSRLELMPNGQRSCSRMFEGHDSIEKICCQLPKQHANYIRIISGSECPEVALFDEWALDQTGYYSQDLPPESVEKLAYNYLHLSNYPDCTEQIDRAVGSVLGGYSALDVDLEEFFKSYLELDGGFRVGVQSTVGLDRIGSEESIDGMSRLERLKLRVEMRNVGRETLGLTSFGMKRFESIIRSRLINV